VFYKTKGAAGVFLSEVTARSAAYILKIEHNSAALFYNKIRQVIAHHLQNESNEIFDGCIELGGSYFGGVRKGKRGGGAAGKVAVFGILKRRGKVYTVVVSDTKAVTLFTMSVSTIQCTFPRIKIISMVLKIFGVKLKES